jgi:secondary thiamine-phosphate synthase enzyme|tara:strand:+ start:445 stop:861 length:417 start_codon:yes stop_codon:yes gene_type:complete
MSMHQTTFEIQTNGRGMEMITGRVAYAVAESQIQAGIVNVFIHHTSASLIIQENADPDVRTDLDAFFARLVPDGDPLFRHTDEGPDDMSAHIRSVLTATSLNIPVINGRLGLGTWQGVYLWEHRLAPHMRRVTVTILG